MKKRWLFLLLLAPLLTGASFTTGEYPGIYNSGSSLVTSGVIWAGPNISNYGACEFYTASTTPQMFIVYNSPTVAGQSVANMIGFCEGTSTSPCAVSAAGPTGPTINAAIVAGKGLSWASSTTFPSQTLSAGNAFALCSFNIR